MCVRVCVCVCVYLGMPFHLDVSNESASQPVSQSVVIPLVNY